MNIGKISFMPNFNGIDDKSKVHKSDLTSLIEKNGTPNKNDACSGTSVRYYLADGKTCVAKFDDNIDCCDFCVPADTILTSNDKESVLRGMHKIPIGLTNWTSSAGFIDLSDVNSDEGENSK